jgi:AdoMet-dependent heme synthase
VVAQHRQAGEPTGAQSGFLLANQSLRSARGVNDGNGFIFISHIGEVYPSGFLPVSAGNVRTTPLAELYRNSPLFQELRNPALLKGKCGVCEFRSVCGGSRAWAYGVTSDYLESDPACAYIPRAYAEEQNALP